MKLSSIYGKKVLSTAGKEGYVLAVFIKENAIECLICADENENEFTIGGENIKSISKKIVFKEGESAKLNAKPLRLGLPVYDCTGELLGKLSDCTLTKTALTFAHVGNKKFSFDDIVVGDAIIIKSSARILRSDVKSKGKIIIRRGTPLSDELLKKAQKKGEYIQTNLKSI